MMGYRIIPYHPDYEAALLELESVSAQGKHIWLEMLRDHFLARSEVFEEYGVFLALSENGDLLGVAAGSAVTLEWNGKRERVGFAYDLRVAPPFRRKGIATFLGRYLTQEYFKSLGVNRHITTIKASNWPAARVARSTLGITHYYPFSYLTIPTGMRIRKTTRPGSGLRFRISGFGVPETVEWVYRHPNGNPALFRTDLTYRVRAIHIAPWLNFGMRTLELFKGADWKLPRLGKEVRFATAFDLGPENLQFLNDLLDHLQKLGIQYLVVCCLKGDYCHRNLRRLAVNSLDYRILVNFPLKPSDSLTLDVRCL